MAEASRLIFVGVDVSTTTCLGSICSELTPLCRHTFSPLPVSAVETCTSASPVLLPTPPSSKKLNTTITLLSVGLAVAPVRPCWERVSAAGWGLGFLGLR